MIVAKCSHDADLLCWLGGAPAASLSSYGDRSWFREENAPAGAPARCTDGCPVKDCLYDSHRYLTDKFTRDSMATRGWLVEGDGADRVVMCAPF